MNYTGRIQNRNTRYFYGLSSSHIYSSDKYTAFSWNYFFRKCTSTGREKGSISFILKTKNEGKSEKEITQRLTCVTLWHVHRAITSSNLTRLTSPITHVFHPQEEVKEFIILRAQTAETPKQPGISTIPLAWNVVYFMLIWAQRWGTCRLQLPPPFTSINSPVFTTAQTGSTTHLLTHGLQRHVTVHAATISEQMSPQSL